MNGALATHDLAITDLGPRLAALVSEGGQLLMLTAWQPPDGGLTLLALVLPAGETAPALWRAAVTGHEYPSLTAVVPQAHWAERALGDFFGLRAVGHPEWQPLLLHEAWPAGYHPQLDDRPVPTDGEPARYEFLEVTGEGVYEIPVGPIHAGIIEPGHFRFSCFGEVIQNLEIRLGYQHRGLERQLAAAPWQQARFVAEAVSSDTAVGNALAHAWAIEQLLGVSPPPAAVRLRAAALELERIACHLGDLNGLCADIGFITGAALFSRLRGASQGLGERLTGSRFLNCYVVPGGVVAAPSAAQREALLRETAELSAAYQKAEPLLLDNAGVLERMEGTGVVPEPVAADIGLVGPAGRASGRPYDVRAALRQSPYHELGWQPALGGAGDVLARAQVRADELRTSLALLSDLLAQAGDGEPTRVPLPDTLPANAAACGVVEAWRGELVHLILTGSEGAVARYAVKDPSLNNWTGLAIAARGELVSDFPLCNKSFSLSYSGNDL